MKYILVLLFAFTFISCTETDESFDCSSCKEYEVCNEDNTKCELKEGSCLLDSDCTDGKCNKSSNICENSIICEENSTKCDDNTLLTCKNNSWQSKDCTLDDKICETQSNISSCIEVKIEDGTIYPIRTGEVALESSVTVNGVITGIKLDNSKVEGIYIQEAGKDYRGIYIYAKNRVINSFKIGDDINVTGIYKEYNGLSEIIIDDNTIVDNDNFNPIKKLTELSLNELVTQRVERYESMLVEINGDFTVTDRDDHGNFTIVAENGSSFEIKNDLYNIQLIENDKLSTIRGVLTFNYNKFKILPREATDLIDNSSLCAALSCNNGEICKIADETASCVCDNANGYYSNGDSCQNPCDLDGSCIEENRHQCKSIDATNVSCSCDRGYEEDEGICKVAPYCDRATYGSAFGKTGDELRAALKIIVNRNFRSYGYDTSRFAMFSHIYNENGVIRCVYTGEYYNHPYQEDRSLQTKPDNADFNWEHTWPQSRGLNADAKCDLHHMYPTRSYVNSARSNYPFGNVTGGDEYGSGDYISRRKNSIFEPADQHKGNVARAMLYMWIKYDNPGGFMDQNNQFELFQQWHILDPVDDKERERNDIIETYQYNRNPLVDCPQFVEKLTN